MNRVAALRIANDLEVKARKAEGDLSALRARLAALHQERRMLFEMSAASVDLHGFHVRMQSARLRRIAQEIVDTQAAIYVALRRLDLARRRCAAVADRSVAVGLMEAETERARDIAEWVALRLGRTNASFPQG